MTTPRTHLLPPHLARRRIHEPDTFSQRAADVVSQFSGSWRFLGLHAVWFTACIATNGAGHDRYPYQLLTLAVSLEAIALSSIVLLSQQRAAVRDRARDELEASEVHISMEELRTVRAISEAQNAVLAGQDAVLAILRAHFEPPEAP